MSLLNDFVKYLEKVAIKILNIPTCSKCGSTNLNHSYSWNGGYNNMCNQGIGRAGTRCFDCGNIVWDQTDEEYERSLPHWCKIHKREESNSKGSNTK